MWTDERIAELPTLWEKHSALEIAKMWGVTRNSVIGRIHRIKGGAPQMKVDRRRAPWPPEAIKIMQSNWDGNGSGVIAGILAQHGYHFSRNAILNKGRRLGLPLKIRGKEARVVRVSRGVVTKQYTPGVFVRATTAPEHWSGAPVSILSDDLRHYQCRYIVEGSGISTMFCAGPVDPESALTFCAHHKHLVTRDAVRTWSDEERARQREKTIRRLSFSRPAARDHVSFA